MADLIRLYRDHNMDHTMLSKHEFSKLTQLINDRLLKPYDDDALNLPGFIQFFWQTAIFCHQKSRFKASFIRQHNGGRTNFRSLSLAEMIQNLVTWFKVAAKARDRTLAGLYEFPELASDPLKASQLYALNEKVRVDPTMILPSGFVLSKELEQVKEYGLPENAPEIYGESKAIALQILSGILEQSVGVHLYEPVITTREKHVVKLAIQQQSHSSLGPRAPASDLFGNVGYGSPVKALNNKQRFYVGTKRNPSAVRIRKNSLSGRSASQMPSIAVQSMLQNHQTFDESDIYGLGLKDRSSFRSQPQKQSQQASSGGRLAIYRMENILKIADENKRQFEDSISLL